MESGPPKMIEAMAAFLIPSACREETLGDMRERYQSPARYLLESAQLIPCVIYSRIRRTADPVVILMEAASMFTAFVIAARWLNPALLFDEVGFLRLAIPAVITLTVTVLVDAYRTPSPYGPLEPLQNSSRGFVASFLAQFWLGSWALPAGVFAFGSGSSILLVSTLRLVFPPLVHRSQTAKVPAFWQKLEIVPPAVGRKAVLLPFATVLALMAYLLLNK
ncbi:MAG: hypothetical protein JO323_09360 [Acidobacteriia bacterium]|nr:hypothetical protein [Terriglobia bacterium]